MQVGRTVSETAGAIRFVRTLAAHFPYGYFEAHLAMIVPAVVAARDNP